MKQELYYISLAFAKDDPLTVAGFAENIAIKTATITEFASLLTLLPPITAAAMTLRLKEEAMSQGGSQVTGERDDAFDALVALLRSLATKIEAAANNNRDLMLASGFVVNTPSSTPASIDPTSITDMENNAVGKLMFWLQSTGARAYEIWGRTGTDDFKHMITVTDPRGVVVDNLISGALYDWKVRALYPRNTYSEWSDVTSRRVT